MMTREAFASSNQRDEIDLCNPACASAVQPCDDENRELE